MKLFTDYYSVLQVHPTAESEVIRGAYKRLCQKYHPDVNPSREAEERIRQINAAYEILGNDVKRRAFHLEWQRRSRLYTYAPNTGEKAPEGAEKKPFTAPPTHKWTRPSDKGGKSYAPPRAAAKPSAWTPPFDGTKEAREAIHQYFLCISKRDLEGAYDTLSEADRRVISKSNFLEWQTSVGTLYEIGSFSIKLFKTRSDIQTDADTRVRGEEYTVHLAEKTVSTGQVAEYSIAKTAIFEQGKWRVYLGYTDVSVLVSKFKQPCSKEEPARAAADADPPVSAEAEPRVSAEGNARVFTEADARAFAHWNKYLETHDAESGALNLKGIKEKAELEIYRYKRHQHNFTVALFKVGLPKRISDEEHVKRILRFAGDRVQKGLRLIDHFACIGDGYFVVLFSEAERHTAKLAAKRLLFDVKREVSACFDVEVLVASGLVQYDGSDIDSVLFRSRLIIKRMEENAAAPKAVVR